MAKKITKQELKKPDEFYSFSWKTLNYILEHKKEFYIALAIFVLVSVLSGSFYAYRSVREAKAEQIYSSAYNTYFQRGNKDEYLKAIEIYEQLTKEYPNSHASVLAFYNMGNIYFELEEPDKAIDAYKSFLKNFRENDILEPLAYCGLGYCHEMKKDYENALKYFQDFGKTLNGKGFKVLSYINTARIYGEMNDKEKAMEYYEKALSETADPGTEMLIKIKMSMLG